MRDLKQILAIPATESRDDDHLDRKDISADEFDNALTELAKKYKNMKPTISDEQRKKMNQATLDAMNAAPDDSMPPI